VRKLTLPLQRPHLTIGTLHRTGNLLRAETS
jgi:hypothetical protein